MYERYKKQDQTFVAIGSEEDERAVKKMNEQAADKEKEQKAESVHEEVSRGRRQEKCLSNMVTRRMKIKRFFRTLMGVLSIFDREDLKAVYELVMEKYQDEIPEGFDKMLWGG
ncbi:hypothetical protein Tco_1031633 [Tanacetum coccineum]|uniref:Uncharacterized protein n=1 Tax=Tanacetum coccineum TaxID=301880 RepID=A0ABQ5G9K3_9ASTR